MQVEACRHVVLIGGDRTDEFFQEALHSFEVLTAAGFQVDLASETCNCASDDISMTPPLL